MTGWGADGDGVWGVGVLKMEKVQRWGSKNVGCEIMQSPKNTHARTHARTHAFKDSVY